MKKTFAFLILLWATAICCFAQDTISGVVSRVAAPYFEQNVCDSRFALVADGETYYVMVDNYWPNPYLEELVVHYDTVPVGNEIEVVKRNSIPEEFAFVTDLISEKDFDERLWKMDSVKGYLRLY